MDGQELRNCLYRIGWSQGELSRILGLPKNARAVRNLAEGRWIIPEDLADWLISVPSAIDDDPRAGHWLDQHPPPAMPARFAEFAEFYDEPDDAL